MALDNGFKEDIDASTIYMVLVGLLRSLGNQQIDGKLLVILIQSRIQTPQNFCR